MSSKGDARIVRGRYSSRFTTYPNETLQDDRLDYFELGLLIYILSHPENWECRVKQLRRGRYGRDRIRKALRNLRTLGYVSYCKARGEKGRIEGVYYVFGRPEDNDKPDVGASAAKAPVVNNHAPLDQSLKRQSPVKPAPAGPDSGGSGSLQKKELQKRKVQRIDCKKIATAAHSPSPSKIPEQPKDAAAAAVDRLVGEWQINRREAERILEVRKHEDVVTGIDYVLFMQWIGKIKSNPKVWLIKYLLGGGQPSDRYRRWVRGGRPGRPQQPKATTSGKDGLSPETLRACLAHYEAHGNTEMIERLTKELSEHEQHTSE